MPLDVYGKGNIHKTQICAKGMCRLNYNSGHDAIAGGRP